MKISVKDILAFLKNDGRFQGNQKKAINIAIQKQVEIRAIWLLCKWYWISNGRNRLKDLAMGKMSKKESTRRKAKMGAH